jgi:acetyl esterase/lipase
MRKKARDVEGLTPLHPKITAERSAHRMIRMVRIILLVLTALLTSACVSHQGQLGRADSPPRQQAKTTVTRNVIFTPADWPQPLACDLYVPSGTGPFPAVVMIHGGGWKSRTRDDMNGISQAVAERGYVVMNVSYRLAPTWRFPAQLHDIQRAVLWLRANAAAYNVRANRIGVWGYSAGAHLAALAAVTSPGDREYVDGARVQALVAGGTPVDLRYYTGGPLTNGLMGVAYADAPDKWRDASPVALVTPDDPPTFLYHGTFDFTVGVKNAHAMYDALNAAGVPAELYLYRGLEHFSTFFLTPVETGADFLDRHLR